MSRPELRLESVQATGQVTVGRRGLRTAGGVCPAAGYARPRGVGGGKDNLKEKVFFRNLIDSYTV